MAACLVLLLPLSDPFNADADLRKDLKEKGFTTGRVNIVTATTSKVYVAMMVDI